MILPVTLAVWIGLVGSVFTGARRLFRTITLSYCCRVTPVLTVHFVHRSCIILVVLDSVVILFTRRPCPADMEPTDDGAGHRPCAMTEMIFLFIASLAGMMIVPCNRALVLQCSSLPSMAYLRFPLACRILLTIVLAPLASAWTSSNLPMPIVPPATSLPLAPRPGTPCATHVCKLPSVTIQGGAVHVLKPNGTSTCSLGESLDLKHAADLKAPLDVSVWDDLPHSPTRPVVPLTPAMLAGPCLSDLDMCTTDSCSSLGPEQPNQASCAACACRAHTAAPCTIPRTPTATRPSALYENETYSQPSGDLCLPPSQIGEVPPSPSSPRLPPPVPSSPLPPESPPSPQPPPPSPSSPSLQPPLQPLPLEPPSLPQSLPLPLPQSLPLPPSSHSSPPGLSQLPWARLLPLGLPQPPLVPPPPSPTQPQLPALCLSPSPSSSPPRPPSAPSAFSPPPWLPQSPPPQQLSPPLSPSAQPPTEPSLWLPRPLAPQLPALPISRSPVRVGVLRIDLGLDFPHDTPLRALGHLAWPALLVVTTVLLLCPIYLAQHTRSRPHPLPAAMRLMLLMAVLSCLVPVAEGAGTENTEERHARRLRSMGMEAAIAALASAFGLAALRSRFAEDADRVAHSPSCVGAAVSSPVGQALTCNTSASRIAAAWRACRQSRAAHAASRLTAALSDASHAARRVPSAQATGAYAPPLHRTAAAQVLIRSWRATAARRRASAGCALLKAVHRPKLQSTQTHSPDAPTKFLPGPVVIATTSPFGSVGAARLGASLQLQSPLPPGLGLTGSTAHPGATSEALAARKELRRSADDGLLQSITAAPAAVASAAPWTRLASTAVTSVGAGSSPTHERRQLLADAAETCRQDRRTRRSVAFGQQTSRQREAGALLASVQPHTWCILAFCLRLRRRAEQRAIAQLHSRLLQYPQCARFVACLRARVSRRAAALKLLSSPPHPLGHDVGYDGNSGEFSFRDVRGVVTARHPAFTATAETIPAYSPDGSVVLPMSPPSTSMVVLRPEASGAWCYCDTALGTASWYPPDGSTSLVARLFPEAPPVSEERPPRIPSQVGLNSLTYTGWASIFRDGTDEVFLVHQQTGAVRSAPWIVLRTRDGRAYFANLLTRETRWLPPHLWMQGWVSRLEIDSASPAGADIGSMSQALSSGGRDLPCDCRRPLPTLVGRQRVEGGAPYMYELALGVPQYPPDERWDSQLTYPLEGNYARWPRASTPDPQQVPLRLTGWERELPGSHEVCPRLWLTIAAADAADAREASKPHRVSDAVRQPSGTYTAEPGDSLPMTSSVLFSGFPEVVELDRPLPSAHDWPVQSDGLSPLERQQVKDEAEYWLMHREAEAREMQDEADYWDAAASHEEMLEKQHELEVEQVIETSRCLPPPNIYLQAERSCSRPTLSPTSSATLAARCAPLLTPRFADHALLLRAVSLIQRAWFWHAHRYWLPGYDASEYVAVTPSGTRLTASAERIRRGPTDRTSKAMLHAVGRGGEYFLLTPPPFRFVLQLPLDDPIDNGVLPGRAGLLGEYLYF